MQEVDDWFCELLVSDPQAAEDVAAAITLLERTGPTLGRPAVDRLKGSNVHNMKELRPATKAGTTVRILFVFDPARQAILLAAGDKTRQWKQWYDTNIPLAERRYAAWLAGEYDEEIADGNST